MLYKLLAVIILIALSTGFNKVSCQNRTLANDGKIKLVIRYNLSLPTDTLVLQIGTVSINSQSDTYLSTRNSSGTFVFSINTDDPYGYFKLTKLRPTRRSDNLVLIEPHFWEAGDDLIINIAERERPAKPLIIKEYIGIGSEKYQAWEDIERNTPLFLEKLKIHENPSNNYTWENIANDRISILDKYRNHITAVAYDILKIKILMRRWTGDIDRINNVIPEMAQQSKAAEDLNQLYFPLRLWVDNDEALANSFEYIRFYTLYFSLYPVYSQGKYDKEKFPHANIDVQKSLELIKNSSSGKIQQALIVNLLTTVGRTPTLESVYENVKTILTDEYYSKQLERLAVVDIKNISQYVLTDQDGKEIKISDFKGKILFIDTWFTGCSGCAVYYRSVVSKLEEHFKEGDNVVLLSISSDLVKETWLKSVSTGLYCNPSGMNLYTSGQKMNHPMYQYLQIKSAPTALLLDKDGNVLFLNTAELYDIEKLISHIEDLL